VGDVSHRQLVSAGDAPDGGRRPLWDGSEMGAGTGLGWHAAMQQNNTNLEADDALSEGLGRMVPRHGRQNRLCELGSDRDRANPRVLVVVVVPRHGFVGVKVSSGFSRGRAR
jgi:hypothetical protein